MSDPADRYCSDCAWPYECAAAGSCHRRDMGEVRGEDLTPRPELLIPTETDAEEASRRAKSALAAGLLTFGVITAEEYVEQCSETLRGRA